MSQNNSNQKTAMLDAISNINRVDDFDPTPFAVDYTDLNTNETRKRLPVMIQMAWFRLKYPEGKIALLQPQKFIRATGIRSSATLLRQRLPEDYVKRNRPFLLVNGRKPPQLESRFEMPDLDFNLL